MADLPDIDTTNVGLIAYWNAIDQGGVASIDPDEALNNSRISSYTVYDNGWQGVYQYSYADGYGRGLNVRVKTDGWIVCYITRENDYDVNVTGRHLAGYWDVANTWSSPYGAAEVNQNTLERTINDLRTELSNSGSMTYNTSDVGLYQYPYTASSVSVLSSRTSGPTFMGSYQSSTEYGYSYTSDTDIKYNACAVVAEQDYGFGSGPHDSRGSFEGTTIADTANGINSSIGDGGILGTLDIQQAGLVPNSGTEYRSLAECAGNDGAGSPGESTGNVIITNFIVWN